MRSNAPKKAVRALYVSDLSTADQVRREATRVYKEVRRKHAGNLSIDDAYKLGLLLQSIAKLVDVADWESRVEALERLAEAQQREIEDTRPAIRRA